MPVRSSLFLLVAASMAVPGIFACGRSEQPAPRAGDPPATETFGRPAVLARDAGERLMLQGRKPLYIKVDPKTLGSTTLVAGYEDIPPGDSIRVHKHLAEDEVVFVHRGVVDLTLGDSTYQAESGGTVFIPRGTWVGIRTKGADTASIFFVFNTPAFEKCLRALSAPVGQPFVMPSEASMAATRRECHQVRRQDVAGRMRTPP